MNHQTYNDHAVQAARKGLPLDPMIVMAFYRDEMRTPAARKYGHGPARRMYIDLRAKVTERCYGLMHAENLYRDSILAPAARPLGRLAA